MTRSPDSQKSTIARNHDASDRETLALKPRLEKMLRERLHGSREFVEIKSLREGDETITGFVMTRSSDRQQKFLQDFEVRLTPDGAIQYLEVDGKRIKVKG